MGGEHGDVSLGVETRDERCQTDARSGEEVRVGGEVEREDEVDIIGRGAVRFIGDFCWYSCR